MTRLDVYLVQQGLVETRTRAANLIKLGGVSVDGQVVRKAAYDVAEEQQVAVDDKIGFASLGGLKLQKALATFALQVRGLAIDIGASNGGFTHCLLQAGADKVYAVDVGECALPDWLANDDRVVVLDKTNARSLPELGLPPVDMVVADVSFISITLLLPVIAAALKSSGWAVVLVKPQFEVGKSGLTKTGLVKSEKLRQNALNNAIRRANGVGLRCCGTCEVPRLFADKNIEYLVYLRPTNAQD